MLHTHVTRSETHRHSHSILANWSRPPLPVVSARRILVIRQVSVLQTCEVTLSGDLRGCMLYGDQGSIRADGYFVFRDQSVDRFSYPASEANFVGFFLLMWS